MTDELPDEVLQAIEERANAARPGPWERGVSDPQARWLVGGGTHVVVEVPRHCEDPNDRFDLPNIDFIAHAREDIPALIKEIRRLRNKK